MGEDFQYTHTDIYLSYYIYLLELELECENV